MSLVTATWTHPRTGETRHYINNWHEVAGFEVDKYKTGNIRSAALDGGHISNTKAAALYATKFWVGADGEVHTNGHGEHVQIVLDMLNAAR